MIRRFIQGSCLTLLGLILAAASAGCGDPNESEFREGAGNQQGKADPKYSHGSEQTYKQFYKDSKDKAAMPKESKGAKAAPAAPAPPEKKE